MFYMHELLSCRQRGKLARCWLAATISEKMFKKKYGAKLIQNINVSIICEEILRTVEIRKDGSHVRFSLYLSSQLMYGATKILSYQTKFLEDNLFNIHRTLFKLSSHVEDFTVIAASPAFQIPSEVPSIIDVLQPVKALKDLHLMRDEPYTSIVRDLMEDTINFGAISNLEVQEFLLLGTEEPSLNDIRRVSGDDLEGISREFVQAPRIGNITFGFESIETEKETRVPSVGTSKEKSWIVSEDQQPQDTAPATPKKRTLQSPPKTPSKKSKISSEGAEELLQPSLEPFHQTTPPPAGPEDVAALEESRGQKKGKRRKLFDKKTTLSSAVMRKWISNVRACTREEDITLPQTTDYLKRPSVNLGKSLTKLYQRILVKPVEGKNEFFDEPDYRSTQTIHFPDKESVRPYSPSKPEEQTDGQTLSMITIPDMSHKSKTIIRDTIIEQPENPVYGEETTEMHHISDKHDSDERRPKSPSKSSSSSCSKVYVSKKDFIASLQVYLREGSFIKFDGLISSENYCKNDASRAFQYCLELHTEKIIFFKQAEPFDTLWIEMHSNYSSENDSLAS